jgi:hypothetical protein
VVQGPAHTASGDCITTARIAWKQLRLWPNLAAMDLWELHRLQAEWYAEQAAGYAQYLARKGDTEGAARVSTGWPFQAQPAGATA